MEDKPRKVSNTTEGRLLRLGEGHEVAIYRRDGVCWPAEFRHGRGELIDAASWFRFHAGPALSRP